MMEEYEYDHQRELPFLLLQVPVYGEQLNRYFFKKQQ